ncbi:MAG: hypothetical protein CMH31_04880 [Micavibrio sp.]|nr:hypothetical protein [Micavibrio sp.]|tara:strand:+ start:824 stop:1261 length:438 start_codon:yes stop_codon:yes gene_type:complete
MSQLKKATHGPFAGESQENNLILCDVDGTLFGEGLDGDNEKLIRFLAAAKDIGYEVVIFSNAADGAQFKVRALGLKFFKDLNFFGEVMSKSAYAGERAWVVIDDDHTSHDVKAGFQFSPKDSHIDRMMQYFGAAKTLPDLSDPRN